MQPTESARSRRARLAYYIQLGGAVAAVLLLLISAFVFLTSSSRTNDVVEQLVEQIHEDTTRSHEEIICIIRVPFEDRTDALIEQCRTGAGRP